MVDQKLSVLSEKNTVDILIFMLEARRKESDFTQVVSNYYSVNSTLSKIVDAGLATMSVDKTRYQTRWYDLTLLGRSVALDLKRAVDRINGILPEDDAMNCSSPQEQENTVR